MRLLCVVFVLLLKIGSLRAIDIIYVNHQQICKPPYSSNAILRYDPGFVADYLTLHSLLRMANPVSVFEIGTCSGEGTQIIKNAVGSNPVYSLDVPLGHPLSACGTPIGGMCRLPYQQIIGDSLTINFADYYPLDAWFIDGTHDYNHVLYETTKALMSEPSLIVWHDADISEVFRGIQDGLEGSTYILYRVNNTRVAFSVPLNSNLPKMIFD